MTGETRGSTGLTRAPPELIIIGAEVDHVSPFTDSLSPAVQAALPITVDLVIIEIQAPPAHSDRALGAQPATPLHGPPRRPPG